MMKITVERRTAASGRRAALVLLTVLIQSAPVHAEPLRPIQMADVIALRGTAPRDLTIDAMGVLGDVDVGMGRSEQVAGARKIMEWRGGEGHSLGAGNAPARSPDGRWLLFNRDHAWVLRDERTGKETAYDAGREISAFNGPPVWSADSRFVAATFDLRSESEFRKDEPTLAAPGVRVVIRDHRDGSPPPPAMMVNPRLLIWDLGKQAPTIRDVTAYGAYPGSWRTTEAGHDFFYATGQGGGGGVESFTAIKALHAETLTEREVYRLPNFNQSLSPQISPDGRTLAFIADPSTPNFAVSGRVLELNLEDGGVRDLAPDVPANSLRWGADGRIYFLKARGGLPQLCSIGPRGDINQLTDDATARRGLAVSQDGGTIAYSAADGYGALQIRTWTVTDHRERVLATLADPGKAFSLGRFEPVKWRTPDGLTLNGFVVYPPGFDPSHRYPMLVDIHGGGPGQQFGWLGLFGVRAGTPLDWHAWAALGYVVFVPDFRSSGEYGEAINLQIAHAPEDIDDSRQDADDVASGIRWMLHRPYIDATRIAGIGHSAGGPRLASLLMRTKLFSGAIIDDPVPFGPSGLMLSAVKYGGAALWTRARLPAAEQDKLGADDLFDGWKVTTPTLILVGDPAHGGLDPLSAETLYAMLLSSGTPTRFVHYLDDGHIPLSDASYQDHYREILQWLQRYTAPSPM
jgi:dipeptidyl aminopeptidase/acylaminoacyl peptidase